MVVSLFCLNNKWVLETRHRFIVSYKRLEKMRIEPAIFETQGSMLTTVPGPFLPNQNQKQIIHHRFLPDIDIDFFLPASNDSTVELCDALRAIYVSFLWWPLNIMVKGLVTLL